MKRFCPIALLFFGLLTSGVDGATRSSARYAVTTETTQTSGGPLASAAYSAVGSLGGVAGVSTAGAPALVARHGFTAQFYEVTGLWVYPDALAVNEGSTVKLHADALLDDGTRFRLSPLEVNWRVIEGPITAIDSHGIALAGAVYTHVMAFVGGEYLGHSRSRFVIVTNSDPDNYGIYARDGLPDDWQVQYFRENNPAAAPRADPDGDGQPNQYEHIVGTVPTDAQSRFRFRIERAPGDGRETRLLFSPDTPGRGYHFEFKTDLGPSTPFTTPTNWVPRIIDGPEGVLIDTDAAHPRKFYRMKVSLMP